MRGRKGREDDKRWVGGGRIPRWCRSDGRLSHRSKSERCRRGHGGGAGGGVISQGIGACQKLSGGSILDLSKLQDPRTLGYLLIFGLYSKPIAYC